MVAPYEADACGVLVPSIPSEGPCRARDERACRVVWHDWRERKTGPGFPLAVARCKTHGLSFTLYPPGFYPYGRERLAPVASDGSVLQREPGADADGEDGVSPSVARDFDETVFGAALDAARGRRWLRNWEQPPAGTGPEGRRWYSTQVRRTLSVSQLLGVTAAVDSTARAEIADLLAVETVVLHEQKVALELDDSLAARGRSVAAVLAALPASGCLVDRLAEAGHIAGLWPEPWRWDPRRGVLQPRPFRPVGTRASPLRC